METVKEEIYETPLSSKQENQDAKSEIEQMLLFELLLLVLSRSLKFEVVQCYNKLRKLELTLMDQVIELTLDEGEFHEEVMLKLLKQMLTCETKFKTSEPKYLDIRS